MPSPKRHVRRPLLFLVFALLGLSSLLLGMLIADPMRIVHGVNGARLRAAGAHTETFRAPDGTILTVWVLGPLSAARPVVLLHGLGASADYWTGTALRLRRRGRTVLLPEGPGTGASEAPRARAGYGLANRIASLEAMAQALGLDRFDLVGHSLGGWVAAGYALERPYRVEHLVLVDAGGFTRPIADEIPVARRSFTPTDRPGARHLLDLLFYRKPFPPAGFVLDSLARTYNAPNVVGTVEALGESDGLVGRAPNLPPGTIFFWGEKDSIFPLTGARQGASLAPGARWMVIRGVGHDGPLEAPKLFEETLCSLIEAPPARSS